MASNLIKLILVDRDLRSNILSSVGECHSPLRVVYYLVFCVSPVN
ncbi:hypothetical protein [Okeania sp. SIO2B3]|nr:hypothetical protein [Okeania sp. SIO2B3]